MLSLNTILAVCLGAVSIASACKPSDDHVGPMPIPTKAAPVAHPVDTSKRIIIPRDSGPDDAENAANNKARPTLTDKDLKELKRSLPALKGTRVLKTLEATPRSRLARMTLCSDRAVAEVTADMVSAFKRKKWAGVSVATPNNDKKHRSFSANLGRFRLTGTITQGEFSDCKKSPNQTRVSWSFQERQPPAVPASTPPAGAKAGPTAPSTRIERAKLLPSLNVRDAVHRNPAKSKEAEIKSEPR